MHIAITCCIRCKYRPQAASLAAAFRSAVDGEPERWPAPAPDYPAVAAQRRTVATMCAAEMP